MVALNPFEAFADTYTPLASPLGKRLASLLAGFDRLTIDDADVMIARMNSRSTARWA